MYEACRSSVSMLNILPVHMDPALGSLRSEANYHVHVGRVLDTRVKTSGSE